MAYKMIQSMTLADGSKSPPTQPSGAYVGDLTILDQYDALFYSEVTSITGTLEIDAGYVGDFRMPKVTTIGGSISVVNAPFLTTFELPSLTGEIGLSIRFTNASSLSALSLPNVTSVVNSLIIQGSASLPSFDLSGLVSVGSLSIGFNFVFTAVSLGLAALRCVGPAISNDGVVYIGNNHTLGVNGLTDAVAHTLVGQLTGTGGGPAHDLVTNVTISDNDP